MISLQNIIDDIRAIASSGSNPNEFRIPDEQIAFWVSQVRATLIGQSLAKKDDLNDTWLQTISCFELELADATECCLAPSDCYVLKTVNKLPATIDTWKANWIVSVTTADGVPISKSNRFSNRYQQYNKYTGTTRYYYLKNDYIYIVNDTLLTYINVTALFQDPMEAHRAWQLYKIEVLKRYKEFPELQGHRKFMLGVDRYIERMNDDYNNHRETIHW